MWARFAAVGFEQGIAQSGLELREVLALLDYPSYFELTRQPRPANEAGILERLEADRLVNAAHGRFDITNLGAILFSKSIDAFDGLARKAIRVVVYRGSSRVETTREQLFRGGYASGFEAVVDLVNAHLPQNEHIGAALRSEVRMYPEIAVRELVANALIHQDFSLTGTGPMIEIFAERVEITNPGVPLIEAQRFLDAPPRSRNDRLATLMRRASICEERGSGIDKVISQVELSQLPAPDFRVTDEHTRAVLFAHKAFSEMDRADRIRACYQHAALQCVSNQHMTNATLRRRFGISPANYSMASRVIADAIDAKLVKPSDPTSTSRRFARYLPYWA